MLGLGSVEAGSRMRLLAANFKIVTAEPSDSVPRRSQVNMGMRSDVGAVFGLLSHVLLGRGSEKGARQTFT
jgi:hypothetical protein